MSVADATQPTTAEPTVPQSSPALLPHPPLPQPPAPHLASVAPWNLPAPPPPPRLDGLGRDAGRLLAGAFAIAWVLCPAVEPLPAHDMDYPLWQLPIEIAALGTIIAAVVALWRGNRNSARYGLAAGVLMAVMTMVCPLAGHTPVGWWTWVQTGLSLAVMATSAVLHRYRIA